MRRELNVEGRGPDIQIRGSSSWYSGSEIRVNEGSTISHNDGMLAAASHTKEWLAYEDLSSAGLFLSSQAGGDDDVRARVAAIDIPLSADHCCKSRRPSSRPLEIEAWEHHRVKMPSLRRGSKCSLF